MALGVLVALPSLQIGFYQDDYNLIAALRRGVRPFYDLFRFAKGDLRGNQALDRVRRLSVLDCSGLSSSKPRYGR